MSEKHGEKGGSGIEVKELPPMSLKERIDTIQASILAPTAVSIATKEPLSLGVTSNNFRAFVAKSGPVFAVQDAAVDIFCWTEPVKTLAVAVFYAFVCWYPYLVLVLPNVAVTAILLYTHHTQQLARYGEAHSPLSPKGASVVEETAGTDKQLKLGGLAPASEEVDYLSNMREIQIMMGNISLATDAGRQVAPYLMWHAPRTSLVILQLAVVSGAGLLLVAPYVPWRFVALVAGEGALAAGHPFTRKMIESYVPHLERSREATFERIERLVEDDALSDAELEGDIFLVERVETERREDGVWVPETIKGGELPRGAHRWVQGSEWRVDRLVSGSADGWVYLDISGLRKEREDKDTTRRRRMWVRRAVKL